MADPLADRLYALADRLDRLRPLSQDPEHFHLERDDIRKALIAEAQKLGARAPAGNPRGRFETGAMRVEGREVRVERRGERARPATTKVFR